MANTNIYQMTDTWTVGATTYKAIAMDVTDTSSAAASLLLDLLVGGTSKFKVSKGGALTLTGNVDNGTTGNFMNSVFRAGGTYGVVTLNNYTFAGATNDISITPDLYITRDAANTLAQRNGTNAQAFRIYETFTDSSNYRRLGITLSAGTATLKADAPGTGGGAMNVVIESTGGLIQFNTGASGSLGWQMTSSGHLVTKADNTYDIGASGATRPRSVYAANRFTAPAFVFDSNGALTAPGNGIFLAQNAAGNDFSRFQFGGTTSSFPALKRSTTALHARLADDSAYAPFSAELVTVAAGTATPAAGSSAAVLLFGTTAGFGVYYGSGAPTVSAAQGSIYLRSDGSSVATRLYVNTTGSTTWASFTSSA